jgi:hypothetical protein
VVNDLLIKYVTMPLEPKMRSIVSEIEQHILMFEYEKALEKINLLL